MTNYQQKAREFINQSNINPFYVPPSNIEFNYRTLIEDWIVRFGKHLDSQEHKTECEHEWVYVKAIKRTRCIKCDDFREIPTPPKPIEFEELEPTTTDKGHWQVINSNLIKIGKLLESHLNKKP